MRFTGGLKEFGIIVVMVCVLAQRGSSADVLNARECGVRPDSREDKTPCVRDVLVRCAKEKTHRLVFSPGRYDFWPDQASERYLFVSNNDEGLKRIAFPLIGFDGIEIDGQGATFIFHGFIVPFLVENSTNVSLKNLSIDYARPFHSEGNVLAITASSVDLRISEEFPFDIRNGVLVFTDGKKDMAPQTTVKGKDVVFPYGSLLAFDPVRRETAYMAKDRYGVGDGIVAEKTAPDRVHLLLDGVSAKPGDVLVFGARGRDVPGFILSDSAGVKLTDVNLYHCGGMGVIAQRSRDLVLERVRVTPPPGGKRIVSITADATHFVNCAGRIEMRDCLFENQVDDATNIHGLYARIGRKPAPDQIEVQLIHPQQVGIDFIRPGTRLEIVQGASLKERGAALVKTVERINKEYTLVTTVAPLPAGVELGDSVADADANTADVLIKNCTMRGNRARGILLGSRGKIVVEGNTFHIPGAAILFEGDARFWFEQAGVRDVTIRGNMFDNCNFGVWGQACVEVGSGIAKEYRKTSRYNRNIVIEDNLFRVFGPQTLLGLYSVDGLTFRNNRREKSEAYPPRTGDVPQFAIEDSDNVKIEPFK